LNAPTTTSLSVACPPEIVAVPNVVVPIKNVTLPVIVPAVAEPTDAVNASVPPRVTGVVETATAVVVVAATPVTVSVVLPVEAAKFVSPL
jgi:hypothetical protein